MQARPTLVVFALAATGACLLLLAGPHALTSDYAPAGLGAVIAAGAVARLLGDLRAKDRLSIAAGAGFLGFLVGSVSGVGPFPASLSFAGAFLPAFVLFVAGIGRERAAFELAKLEQAIDDPEARPRAKARAVAIRDEARSAARALDPEAKGSSTHAGDPRAVYAYAAEVIADAHALDQAYAAAVETLGEVPVRWMPVPMRPLMIGNLAFWHLAAGAPDAALAALDRLPEAEAAAEHRPVLRAARALALVHLARTDEALDAVGRSDDDTLPPDRLKPRYAIVRALAARDDASIRAALAAVVATKEGRDELQRMRPAVPASAAAIVDGVLSSAAG
ncbi:Hypothetical protein A7982_07656 [Minicystis rosea]|nr:Hypothetical protein A7982_07656 [Minicystis rosea]